MPEIATITTSCGMPLLIEPMAGVTSAAVTWLLPIGASSEPESRRGLSALLSEVVMRGAGTLDSRAQADAFDHLGAVRSADAGGVYLRLNATLLGSRIGAGLSLLADIVLRPRMEAEALEPARELALQSLAGLRDNPQERAAVMLSQRFNPLPLNRSPLGTEAGLRAVTQGDLRAAWAARAVPRGSILAIAGDVNPQRVADHVNTLLSNWRGTADAPALTSNPHAGTMHHIADESSQVQIFVAHGAPRERDPASTLEKLATAVLSGGPASRLFSEVREKRALCYSVSAGYSPERDFGRVTAFVGTTPDKAQQSLEVLASELARLRTGAGAVTREEFARAVVNHKTSLVFSGESTGARAAALAGDYHRLGRARSLDEIAAAIDAVTLDDLNAHLAATPLGPLTIVTLGPKGLTTMNG